MAKDPYAELGAVIDPYEAIGATIEPADELEAPLLNRAVMPRYTKYQETGKGNPYVAAGIDALSLIPRAVTTGVGALAELVGSGFRPSLVGNMGEALAQTKGQPDEGVGGFGQTMGRDPANMLMGAGPLLKGATSLYRLARAGKGIAPIAGQAIASTGIHQGENVAEGLAIDPAQAALETSLGVGLPFAGMGLKKLATQQMAGNLGMSSAIKKQVPDIANAMDIITGKTPIKQKMNLPDIMVTPKSTLLPKKEYMIDWEKRFSTEPNPADWPGTQAGPAENIHEIYSKPGFWKNLGQEVQGITGEISGLFKGATKKNLLVNTEEALARVEGPKQKIIEFVSQSPGTETPLEDIFLAAKSKLKLGTLDKTTPEAQEIGNQFNKAFDNYVNVVPEGVVTFDKLNKMKTTFGAQGNWMVSVQKGAPMWNPDASAREKVYNALYAAAKEEILKKAGKVASPLIDRLNSIEHDLLPVKQAAQKAVEKGITTAPVTFGDIATGTLSAAAAGLQGGSVEHAVAGMLIGGAANMARRSQFLPKVAYEIGSKLANLSPAGRQLVLNSIGNMQAREQ